MRPSVVDLARHAYFYVLTCGRSTRHVAVAMAASKGVSLSLRGLLLPFACCYLDCLKLKTAQTRELYSGFQGQIPGRIQTNTQTNT